MPSRSFSGSIFVMRSLSVAAVSDPESPPTPTTPPPPAALSPGAQKVAGALRALGFEPEIVEFAESTRTSADAARRIGCEVGQIAKSLVFKGRQSERPVLVIVSGANQVNEWRIGVLLKEALDKAKPAFVREHTGYAIGGVPPVGHPKPIETFIDQDLMKHGEIWAAGGTPNALFRLTPQDLATMTGGRVVKVT